MIKIIKDGKGGFLNILCYDVLIKSNRTIQKHQTSAGNRGNMKNPEKYHVLSGFYV